MISSAKACNHMLLVIMVSESTGAVHKKKQDEKRATWMARLGKVDAPSMPSNRATCYNTCTSLGLNTMRPKMFQNNTHKYVK